MGGAAARPGHCAHQPLLDLPNGARTDGRHGRDQGCRLRHHVLKLANHAELLGHLGDDETIPDDAEPVSRRRAMINVPRDDLEDARGSGHFSKIVPGCDWAMRCSNEGWKATGYE